MQPARQTSVEDAPLVVVRREGRLGRLTLNRPEALHALTTEMCRILLETLLSWRGDPAVAAVLIDHAEGTRGFCAGGDIRMLAQAAEGPEQEAAARDFFFTEYRMNWLLQSFPKPVVVIVDGVVMGGGVGVAAPCRWRVATERTTFAMPESAIGLFPDVGGGWWLPRLSNHAGTWLALTGSRLKAADCLRLGLATHVVPSNRLADLKVALQAATTGGADAIGQTLAKFAVDPEPAPIEAVLATINEAFAHDTVEAIIAALEADGSAWAQAQLGLMAERSPQAMKVALRQLRTGATLDSFADDLAMEYRLATRLVMRSDFREGVRAVLVDKNGRANWSPATLEGVSGDLLDSLFARLPPHEEWTPPSLATPG